MSISSLLLCLQSLLLSCTLFANQESPRPETKQDSAYVLPKDRDYLLEHKDETFVYLPEDISKSLVRLKDIVAPATRSEALESFAQFATQESSVALESAMLGTVQSGLESLCRAQEAANPEELESIKIALENYYQDLIDGNARVTITTDAGTESVSCNLFAKKGYTIVCPRSFGVVHSNGAVGPVTNCDILPNSICGDRIKDQTIPCSKIIPGSNCGSLFACATFTAADGTAAAPAYSFCSDTKTGIYKQATSQLGFATGGLRRVVIDNNGHVDVSAGTATTDEGAIIAAEDGVTTNINLVITPKGTGALQDSNTGNARGANAVDLQMVRTLPAQVAAATQSVIAGGANNLIDPTSPESFIGGGNSNSIYDEPASSFGSGGWSAIAGGQSNIIGSSTAPSPDSDHSFIGGGFINTIGSPLSTIGGGNRNTIKALTNQSCITGGISNTIGNGISQANNSFIGGGSTNTVLTDEGIVVGGDNNKIYLNSVVSFIGGGSTNSIGSAPGQSNSHFCFIGGGSNNSLADATEASGGLGFLTIAGGYSNSIAPDTNNNPSSYSSIGGGYTNAITAPYATIGGGDINNITGRPSSWSTIGGGLNNNIINSNTSTIGGGNGNVVTNVNYGIIGGGSGNAINSNVGVAQSTIGGGNINSIAANYATIAGGGGNTINSGADDSTIAGGGDNVINASAQYSFIGGGNANVIYDAAPQGPNPTNGYSAIAGGQFNVIGTAAPSPVVDHSFIGGGYTNGIVSEYSTISGGYTNNIYTNSSDSTIAGGNSNIIGAAPAPAPAPASVAPYSFIGGGANNIINDAQMMGQGYSTIAGGSSNTINSAGAANSFSFIGGGSGNSIPGGTYGTISGGSGNKINATGGTIGGGSMNNVNASAGTIAGGTSNMVAAGDGAVGGGNMNSVGAVYGAIAGGNTNVINSTAPDSFIGGGGSNTIYDNSTGLGYSTIAGGQSNVIGSGTAPTPAVDHSFIGGGMGNNINSTSGAIVGGTSNSIHEYATESFIGGGAGNNIYDIASTPYVMSGYSTIAGGQSNVIGSGTAPTPAVDHSFIGGGMGNTVLSEAGTVCGGTTNTINPSAPNSFIGGGGTNKIYDLAGGVGYSTIAGGDTNTIGNGSNASDHCFIGGGASNEALAEYATIGGGKSNVIAISASYTTIGGGNNNSISSASNYSTISGGYGNSISTTSGYSTIGGGKSNVIATSGSYTTIGGGENNAIGDNSTGATIPGGSANIINAACICSFAAGQKASVNNPNAFVWRDGTTGSGTDNGINTFNVYSGGGIYLQTLPNVTGTPVQITTGGQLVQFASSARFKENIEILNPEFSDKIYKLDPVRFNFIQDKEKKPQIGFIAEQVKKVCHELVNDDEEGNAYSVKHDAISALMLNELKKLKEKYDAEIKNLHQEVQVLQELLKKKDKLDK